MRPLRPDVIVEGAPAARPHGTGAESVGLMSGNTIGGSGVDAAALRAEPLANTGANPTATDAVRPGVVATVAPDRWLGLGAIRDASDRWSIDAIAGDDAGAAVGCAPTPPSAPMTPPPALDAANPDRERGGRPIDPEAWDRLVEYARVVRESGSDASIRLALGAEVHGGLAMEIRSLGEGRVALHVVSPTGAMRPDGEAADGLRRALASRDLDASMVVE